MGVGGVGRLFIYLFCIDMVLIVPADKVFLFLQDSCS